MPPGRSGRSGGGGGSKGAGNRSGRRRDYQHAPAQQPVVVLRPAPRRSMFRDAAAIAGGVTVGTAVGHVAGEAITGMFSGRKKEQVEESLPRGYQLGAEPSGPCAFEISQFLQCASQTENLDGCAYYNDALKECKKRNRLP
ncbi:coiled-coil-helix-coiled-coil-helix domain-containing protein 10, mitochondrial-like isoform X2 [Plutella xylostella]|uniref:coiled-coil-helix-coiled-coil-helix domain-containing protein 10, mitochondrial-like isoform X2 n=1 Tax=Plutella xylostella TaxID=51655 RepID=UPI0005D0E314|nr:coiled-coil-helix-coiled-coil-helix domain-containing protein 10, mitochondrial-like isoform X2 [Plutella xylostella]